MAGASDEGGLPIKVDEDSPQTILDDLLANSAIGDSRLVARRHRVPAYRA